jgi:hypothetical protein
MVRDQSPSTRLDTSEKDRLVVSRGSADSVGEDESSSIGGESSICSSVENYQHQLQHQKRKEQHQRQRTPTKAGSSSSRHSRGRSKGESTTTSRRSFRSSEPGSASSYNSSASRSEASSHHPPSTRRSHSQSTTNTTKKQERHSSPLALASQSVTSSTHSSSVVFQQLRGQSNLPLLVKRRTDTDYSGGTASSVPTTVVSSSTAVTKQPKQPRSSTSAALDPLATPPRRGGGLLKTKSASSSTSSSASTPKRLLSRLFCSSQKEKIGLIGCGPAFHLSPLDSFTSYDEHFLLQQQKQRENLGRKAKGRSNHRNGCLGGAFPTTVGAFPTTVSEITSFSSKSTDTADLSETHHRHPSHFQQIQHLRPVAEFTIATEAALVASSPNTRLLHKRNMEEQQRQLSETKQQRLFHDPSSSEDDGNDNPDDYSSTASSTRSGQHQNDPTKVPLPQSPTLSPSHQQHSVPATSIQEILAAVSSDTIEELFLHASDSSQTESTAQQLFPHDVTTPRKFGDRTPNHKSSSKRSGTAMNMTQAFLFPDVPTMSESPMSTPRGASRTPVSAKRSAKTTSRKMIGVDEDDDAFLPNALPTDESVFHLPETFSNIMEEGRETYTWEQVQNHVREAEELVRKEMEEEHQFELREFHERAETLFHEQNLKVQAEKVSEQKRMDALLKEEKYRTQQKHRELINKVSVLSEMEQKVDQTVQERKGYLEHIAKLQTKLQELADIHTAEDPLHAAAEHHQKELQRKMKEMERKYRGELLSIQDEKSVAVNQVQTLESQVQQLKEVVKALQLGGQLPSPAMSSSERAEIEELRRAHQEELQALQVESDATDKKMYALNVQIEAMREELNVDLRNDYQRVQRDKAAAEDKIQELQGKLERATERKPEATGCGLTHRSMELEQAHADIATLKSQLAAFTRLEAAAHSYKTNKGIKTNDPKLLQDQLQVAEETVEVLRHKLQWYLRIEGTAGGDLQRASNGTSECDALKQQLDFLQKQLLRHDLIQGQLQAAEETVAVLRRKMDTYSSLEKAVGGDLSMLRLEEIATIAAERDDLHSQIKKMSHDFAHQFQLARQQASQEIQQLRTQLESTRQSNANHEGSTDRALQPSDQMAQEKANLQAQMDYLRQKHAMDLEQARSDALREADDQLDNYRRQVHATQEEKDALLEQTRATRDKLQQQLKQLQQYQESQYEDAKRQGREELASQLEVLTQQVQSVRQESDSERTLALQGADDKLKEYQRQLDAATVEHDRLVTQAQVDRNRLQEDLIALQERQSAKMEEAKLQAKEELEPQLQAWIEQLRSLRQESDSEINDILSKTATDRDLLHSQVIELKNLHLQELREGQQAAEIEHNKLLTAFEEKMANQLAEMAQLRSRHDKVMADVTAQARTKIEALQSQLATSSSQLEEQQVAASAANSIHQDTIGEEIASLREHYEAKIAQVRSETRTEVDHEVQLLRAKLDVAHVKHEREKFDIVEASERDCEALREKLVALRKEHFEQLEEARSQNSTREIESLRRQLEQLQDLYDSCEQEFANKAAAERSELEKYIVEMQEKHREDVEEATTEAVKELELVQEQLEKLRLDTAQDKVEWAKQSEGMVAKLDHLQEMHQAELEGARIEARNQIEKDLRELEKHVEAMQSEDGHLVQKITLLEANAEAYKQECERQVQEIRADHDKQIEELLGQLDLVEAEHNERNTKQEKTLGEKDAVISALGNQLAESQTRIRAISLREASLDKEAVTAQEEVARAKQELARSMHETERLLAAHKQALEVEVKLREKACNQAREEMIARAEIQFEQANVTYKKLKHEYDAARLKILALERDVKVAEQKAEEVQKNQESRQVDLEDELAQAKACKLEFEIARASLRC